FMWFLHQAQQHAPTTLQSAHDSVSTVQMTDVQVANVQVAKVPVESVIVVKDLVRKFGDFTAVASTSFDVKRGEIFGLLGPNGAGKT
ncbi:ABC transporter ATP-binding protein, partial [Acinetobacter nosocomialis]